MSALALSRNYELQLPNSYVDFDREEMEYVDGGAEKINYWWGYAINMNASECAAILPIFKKTTSVCTFATLVSSKIRLPYAVSLQLAVGLLSLNLACVVIDLETASKRSGGTLVKTPAGYSVNVW